MEKINLNKLIKEAILKKKGIKDAILIIYIFSGINLENE